MSNDQIIRAWRDENYRSSLSESERAQLPSHPSGLVELGDLELSGVSGGFHPPITVNIHCPTVKKYCI